MEGLTDSSRHISVILEQTVTLLLDELGQRYLRCVLVIASCLLCFQISQGLDFLDEMQARNLELSSFSFNPFIREFGRWTMLDEVGLRV